MVDCIYRVFVNWWYKLENINFLSKKLNYSIWNELIRKRLFFLWKQLHIILKLFTLNICYAVNHNYYARYYVLEIVGRMYIYQYAYIMKLEQIVFLSNIIIY